MDESHALLRLFDTDGDGPRLSKPFDGFLVLLPRRMKMVLDRLYLIGINATYDVGKEVTQGSLFPGYDNRFLAHWFQCLEYFAGWRR